MYLCVVCPDFLDQALVEGECQQLADENIGPDWVEIIKNQKQYSELKRQRTVFDSTGWALEDKVVMDLFINYAERYKIGTLTDVEIITDDVLNPYQFIEQHAFSYFNT